MKIVLRIYKEIRIGNLSTMILDIPHNKITVKDLKEKIYHKYRIKPSEQRLTFRICHKKLITLTDNFPLYFFYIKEYSMIFLEIISNDASETSKIKTAEKKQNSIKIKYMNVLGYFLPDSKTMQRNQNKYSSFKNSFYQNKKVYSFNGGNTGSEIIVGKNVNNEDYIVGIANPFNDDMLKVFKIQNKYISIKSIYHDQYNNNEMVSVVVMGDDIYNTELAANLLFINDYYDGKEIAKKYNVDVIWCYKDNKGNEVIKSNME